MIATASPCVSTVKAPAAPPASIHHGIVRARTPDARARKPRLPAGSSADKTISTTSPDPKEMTAAVKPSSSRSPS